MRMCWEQIKHRLQTFKDEEDGRSVVKAVHKKEEIYDGPYMDTAPDLLIETESGYDPKGPFVKTDYFGFSGLSGMHTGRNAFISVDNRWRNTVFKNLEDVGSLLVNHYNGAGR